jgi:hypothetical protein
MIAECPLCPKKRTFSCGAPSIALGHKRPHAPRQIAKLFDHLVGVCEQRGGTAVAWPLYKVITNKLLSRGLSER